ncbi:MAG: DNA/RNA helicase domain-containing protein, partial [Dehalococcoidia bacterium]
HDFRARWNLTDDGSLWILKPESIAEIGCIHTCQGLELDYVGVIIGEDFVVRDGVVVTQPEKRARHDRTIFGWKKMAKAEPERARRETRSIILNTYRTLMTRGMKGCFVWCVDEETGEYLRGVGGS